MALHEKAVKRIIYYLQCTRDKPLIITKTYLLTLTVTVISLAYGINSLHTYVIHAYRAPALSSS
jgi:hypothetical protein